MQIFILIDMPNEISNSFVHKSVPILRRHITTQEIAEIVVSVRKQSIMRNLLADVRPDSLKQVLINKFTAVSKSLKEEGIIPQDSPFLPVQVINSIFDFSPQEFLL